MSPAFVTLGQGVSKRLGPVVNIVTRFNVFRPTAYLPIADPLAWERRVYSWYKFLFIGYGHTGPDVAWGQVISKEQGLQLLYGDLLKLESRLREELCLFSEKHYLLRAALISRAFHEGERFFGGEIARAMNCESGSRFAFNARFRCRAFLEESFSWGYEELDNRQQEIRLAEIDLLDLFGLLRELQEKAKRDAGRASRLRELRARRLASRRPQPRLAGVEA